MTSSPDFSDLKLIPQKNLFEVFSLKPVFDVDQKILKTRYRNLQLALHPDQQVQASEEEKLRAVQLSSIVNDAFEILRKPLKRARYLLELAGVDLNKNRAIDASILMEQMELREQFDEIRQSSESESLSEQLLQKLKLDITHSTKAFSQLSNDLFESDAATKEKDLNEMRQVLSRMLFINKLIDEVESVVNDFD